MITVLHYPVTRVLYINTDPICLLGNDRSMLTHICFSFSFFAKYVFHLTSVRGRAYTHFYQYILECLVSRIFKHFVFYHGFYNKFQNKIPFLPL